MPPVPKSSVIVPLYQYPINGHTWQPLYQAISDNPQLSFIVIVNPNSGPGVDPDGWLPDKHYFREIPRLNACRNVVTVGYIRLDYCRRPLWESLNDVKKYANWSRRSSTTQITDDGETVTIVGGDNLAVHGVFFDEVPNVWKEEEAEYLDNVSGLVKTLDGILGDQLVIHNCGTVPDPEYVLHWSGEHPRRPAVMNLRSLYNLLMQNVKSLISPTWARDPRRPLGAPEIVVVFEESSNLWHKIELQTRLARLLRYKRENCCYMIHSVPQDLIEPLTLSLRTRGGYLFVTGLSERYYETFGDSWEDFMRAMAIEKDQNAIGDLHPRN